MKLTKKKAVQINEEFCKECGICIKFCPEGTLGLKNTFNSKGFHPVKWKSDCSLCGICYIVCPDYAIEIEDDESC